MIPQSVTFLNLCAVSSLGRRMKTQNLVKSNRNLPTGDRGGGKMDRHVSRMIDLRVHVKLPYIMPFQHIPNKPNDTYHMEIMNATEKWAGDLVNTLEYEVANTM